MSGCTSKSNCTCGCCEGIELLTPLPTANRPGLGELKLRIGSHSSFLETMKARLSSHFAVVKDEHGNATRLFPLRNLKTRDASDPSIALLDASAAMLDVMTFYQERIANEGYLRTATERRSILELARLVGYALKPGVSASVFLAFMLNEAFKDETIIPAGTAAATIPGANELPQTFETAEPLRARAAWNQIKPRMSRPQNLSRSTVESTTNLYFQRSDLNLKANDALLFVLGDAKSEMLHFRRILAVEAQAPQNRTRVVLQATPKAHQAIAFLDAARRLFEQRESLFPKKHRDRLGKLFAGLSPEDGVENLRARMIDELDKVATPPEGLSDLKAEILKIVSTEVVSDSQSGASTLASGISLASLAARPSLQPASFQSLTQKTQTLFQGGARGEGALSGSIGGFKMLEAFEPRLKTILPQAAANQQIGALPELKVYVFRQKAALFAHSSPGKATFTPDAEFSNIITTSFTAPTPGTAWGGLLEQDTLPLSNTQEKVVADSWAVIENSIEATHILTPVKIDRVKQATMSFDVLAATVTQLVFPPGSLKNMPSTESFLRNTFVHVQPEELSLAEEPIFESVCDGELELDGYIDGLETGRWIIIQGERMVEGAKGVMASEAAMISQVRQDVQLVFASGKQRSVPLPGDRNHTFLTLAAPLNYCFKRDTVTIYANVVKATHGETKREVLGSGDGSQALQAFTLKAPPLTHTAAATPKGAESSLQVFVNDVQWEETDAIFGLGPADRKFVTKTGDDDKTTLIFGNGREGARLPTGAENIRAVYRSGIGKAGNVRIGQIAQPKAPGGLVKGVVNPLPSSGGADRESRDLARKNAPLGVMALDRLVSVEDYAAFSRNFAGIGKAYAARISDGHRQLVHVTIAGADDIPIDENSDLFINLRRALREFGEPFQPLALAVRELKLLVLQASLYTQRGYQGEKVKEQVRAALLDAFGFERRELGQDAMLGEVISVIQRVRGVAYVDVDAFGGVPEKLEGQLITPSEISDRIGDIIASPRVPVLLPANGHERPAQIAYFAANIAETMILNLEQ
ncbi:MAG: putative baseplate assembly protein [Blastocatellia bacterium]|nr:putative baseplate assembly protein [Blastocatellia bacterium]